MKENVKRTALIVGATGLVGSHCFLAMVKSQAYKSIHIIVRHGCDITGFNTSTLDANFTVIKTHMCNFDDKTSLENVFNEEAFDDVYCCLGTTLKKAGSVDAFRKVDFQYCLTIAELSSLKKAKHFLIITSVGSSAKAKTYYSKTKGELEEAIINLNMNRLSIFRPSLLLGKRSDFRLLEFISTKITPVMNVLLPGKLSKLKAIDASVVGQAMVSASVIEGLNNVTTSNENSKSSRFYYYQDMIELTKELYFN